ncbi:hypothetical protein QAD02_015032 [Eretmocerus hayati]|uniref:Uncharacterized protein n=1 Tax=Eretmocerus hayati TaxID=131215 RepID=A0ACC2PBX3_9HYME|nr:hypothetical protein QAD02_015032 [Eretmocerus hayati]
MSIQLHMKQEDLASAKEPELHSIPCHIDADGPANVEAYFKPYIKKIDEEYFKATFRGHPLDGKKISIPKGYKGVTFTEYKKPEAEEERHIYANGTFQELTYWNYDKLPSKNDPFIAAFDWIDIAEALHSTVDDDDSAQ